MMRKRTSIRDWWVRAGIARLFDNSTGSSVFCRNTWKGFRGSSNSSQAAVNIAPKSRRRHSYAQYTRLAATRRKQHVQFELLVDIQVVLVQHIQAIFRLRSGTPVRQVSDESTILICSVSLLQYSHYVQCVETYV